MNPRYSIIIPIYNAQKFLSRCIESILCQNYSNYELILVDDGSTDDSFFLCEKFAKDDKRINIYHKVNGGVSSARNYGLDKANGEYVVFIDSDDYIEIEYLETLVSNADLCVCGFNNSENINYLPNNNFMEGSSLAKQIPEYVSNPFLLLTPWSKVFKRSIIEEHGLRFDTKMRLFEDSIFVLSYLSLCKSLEIKQYKGYFYDGVWGGTSKYILTLDEVEYRCEMEINTIKEIERSFNCQIDKTCRGFCVNYLDDLYGKYNDKFCIDFYMKYHPDVRKESIYKNFIIYPSYNLISSIKQLYRDKNYNEGKILISKSYNFFTQSINSLFFPRKDEWLLYLLLKGGHKAFTDLFLRCYYLLLR